MHIYECIYVYVYMYVCVKYVYTYVSYVHYQICEDVLLTVAYL